MKEVQITAKVPANKEKGTKEMSCTVGVQYAETAKEAIEAYGEDALLSNALANWRVTIQSNIRSALKRGEAPAEIQNRLAAAKMGVAQVGGQVDAEAAFKAKFIAATPDERKKMIAQLRELAQA